MSVEEKTVYELLLESSLSDERNEVKRLTALLAVNDVGMGDLAKERDELRSELSRVKDELQRAREELEKFKFVASNAALCCIDLNYNSKEASKEWMDGKIAKGAYEYVMSRHAGLLQALFNVGYTEKHKIFEFPMIPKSTQEPQS